MKNLESAESQPFIIPVFLPHQGCPHQCAFCNQTSITGKKKKIPSPDDLRLCINKFLEYKGKHKKSVQVAFYGGNFLGLKADQILSMLHETDKLVKKGIVDSIRFSTRPDSINKESLDLIKTFPVTTIELGVQSMDDQVLMMSKRGHRSEDTKKAFILLKQTGYNIGMQMMVGLPGDNEFKSFETARKITELSPDFVRIYPTVVLKGSLLARWYEKGEYKPLPLERCVTVVKNLYLLFKKNKIPVIRMGLQASRDLEKDASILAGPYHPAFGHLVFSELFFDMAASEIIKSNNIKKTVSIKVHPRSISKIRGLKNKNIKTLKKKFCFTSIKIIPDASVEQDRLIIADSCAK